MATKNKLSDIDRALLVFNARIDNLLQSMPARALSERAYLLNTPAGPLRLAIDGNFVIGHFASPLGGQWATERNSDPHSGKWRHYWPNRVDALCDPQRIEEFAMKLDDVLSFKPTGGQRLMIEQDLREQRRHIARMAEVFAASPDPDAPKHEGCKPPLGVLITKSLEPFAKPVKATKPKAKAEPRKDAKPKRRGRVAKRKVS